MDKVQQIKTYLQNQKKEWRLFQSSEAKYRMEAIDEFLEVLNSLPEEPINDDLEKEIDNYTDDARNFIEYTDGWSEFTDIEYIEKAARHFAKWQQEQFEQNRLKACDSQTKEEAEREWNFVEHMIKKEHRQPTYSDAIEYGRKLMKEEMMKEAIVGVVHPYDGEVHTDKEDLEEYYPCQKVKLIIIKENN